MIFLKSKRLEKKTSDAREPSLYRSICTSIISTLLSLVMLVGTTFAWFTDSVTIGVYTIQAGNLKTAMYFCTELPDESSTSEPMWFPLNKGNMSMFGGMTFTPGTSQTAYLKLENKNDNSNNVAAVKYMFSFEDVAASPVALTVEEGVTTQSLSDALTFTCKTASTISELTNVTTAETRTLSAFTSTEEEQTGPFVITVEKNATKYVALTIGMNTDGSASITPSSIQLRLKIIVTNAGEGSEENIISQLNELMTPSEPVSVPVVTEIENEETSTTEPPTMGTPTAGTPATGTSTMGTPATETPTTGTPTTEPPTTGTPTTETSTTEPPATGTPTTGMPTTGMPTMEMPTEETSET